MVADPLDVLQTPVTPVDPDPTFAARLRARIERALDLPRGVAVSITAVTEPETTTATEPELGAAVPYLAVADARAALEFYVEAFDARLRSEPIVMPDGRIGHSELAIGSGVLYLADAHPEIGIVAPTAGAAAVSLVLAVPDVDATVAAAVARGARQTRDFYEAYGSRNAVIDDPFGHRWMLQQPLPAAAAMRPGDLGYVSVQVPDGERAARFYAAVLGWTYAPMSDPQHRHVTGQGMSIGIFGGVAEPTLFCCYAVSDVDEAGATVRAAGGSAGDVTERPFGRVADCVDNRGTDFAVYQPQAGDTRPTSDRGGDLGYVTLQVIDSVAAREFYGAVLGWSFTPGRVDDGWGVQEPVPMTGMRGGQERAVTIPMWMVDDVPAAVERVRAAGGTATDPERQPYGMTADCRDDQGTRFYLGETGH